MSTIHEETAQTEIDTLAAGAGVDAETNAVTNAAPAVEEAQGEPDERPITDGADDGELEAELQRMESDATTLHREGMISESEVAEKHQQVERTRRAFRDLSRAERAEIIHRRREFGRQLLDRQLSGAAIVPATVRLNHTILKPLFEQWWPYMNRMSINMQRFGRSTFGAEDMGTVNAFFDKQLASLEAYVGEQFEVAESFRDRTEREMVEGNVMVFRPTVTKPSLAIEVEAYSRFSMRVLMLITRFDQVMNHFDFFVWNGVRDQSDVDEEVWRFLRKFHPMGVRGYMTHLRLMTAVRGL